MIETIRIAFLKRKVARKNKLIALMDEDNRQMKLSNEQLTREIMGARLTLFGAIVIAWAKLEGHLDLCNEVAFNNGGKVIERQVPKPLDRKLSFFRKCHKKLAAFQPLLETSEKIADEAHRLKGRRHDIIHGFAEGVPIGRLIELTRHNYSEDGLEKIEITVSGDDLIDLLNKTLALAKIVKEHTTTMQNAISSESASN